MQQYILRTKLAILIATIFFISPVLQASRQTAFAHFSQAEASDSAKKVSLVRKFAQGWRAGTSWLANNKFKALTVFGALASQMPQVQGQFGDTFMLNDYTGLPQMNERSV